MYKKITVSCKKTAQVPKKTRDEVLRLSVQKSSDEFKNSLTKVITNVSSEKIFVCNCAAVQSQFTSRELRNILCTAFAFDGRLHNAERG